ncbi:hypothetical protein [Allosphingosinicella sp.]|uniref:hypothetical protein n=1 Tax=Allosphingosinicella sp. TaxID=2823234 RepID=UPI003783A6E3
MTVIRYSLGKLLGIAFFTGAVAAFWLWVLLEPKTFMFVHGRYGWLIHLIAENAWLSGGLFAAFFGATAVTLMTALGDRTALALGPEGVEARTLLGRHQAGWDRVGDRPRENRAAGQRRRDADRPAAAGGRREGRAALGQIARAEPLGDWPPARCDRPARRTWRGWAVLIRASGRDGGGAGHGL